MTSEDIKRFAAILFVQAKIEGMKCQLTHDYMEQKFPSWSYSDFERESVILKMLATCRDDQLNEVIQLST